MTPVAYIQVTEVQGAPLDRGRRLAQIINQYFYQNKENSVEKKISQQNLTTFQAEY